MGGRMRNIGGDPNDPSYRYKMPCLVAKVEGRGNGIKTRIVNMIDIAKVVHRDPSYITLFMGVELGAQWKMVEKDLLSIVNGKHDEDVLNSVLDKFIARWVVCRNCSLPETDLKIRKGLILAECNACGSTHKCDMKTRLATYILKNPPKKKDKQKVGRGAKAKDKQLKAEEKLAKKVQKLKIDEEEDVEWSTDTSADAAKKRAKEALGGGVAALVALDADVQMAADLKAYLNDASHSNEEKIKYVNDVQKKEGFGGTRRVELLFSSFFTVKILQEMAGAAPVLRPFCDKARAQRDFLGLLEGLVSANEALLQQMPDILMGFYDLEVLEEETLLDWYDVPTAKHVTQEMLESIRSSSEPFIDWLKEGDGDSSEEEEEEEEDEEEEAVAKPAKKEAKPKKKSLINLDSDSDDDDIGLDDL